MLSFPVSGMFETFNVIKSFKLVNEIVPGNSTVGQCWIYKVFVSGFCVCLLDLLIPSSWHCQTSRKSFSKSDSPALSRVLIPLIIVTQRWGLYQSLYCHLEFQQHQQCQTCLWRRQNYPRPLCFISSSLSVDKRHNMPDASTKSFELSHLLKCCWGTPTHLKDMSRYSPAKPTRLHELEEEARYRFTNSDKTRVMLQINS